MAGSVTWREIALLRAKAKGKELSKGALSPVSREEKVAKVEKVAKAGNRLAKAGLGKAVRATRNSVAREIDPGVHCRQAKVIKVRVLAVVRKATKR